MAKMHAIGQMLRVPEPCREEYIAGRLQVRSVRPPPGHTGSLRFHNANAILRPMKCTVAISGGTDSLYALLSLREQGFEVEALHARFLRTAGENDPVPKLQSLCGRLGVPFHVAHLEDAFLTNVMEPFALAHAAARTPNPCALCNRSMKFGLLMDEGLKHGELFATGHYASVSIHPAYGAALRAGRDKAKDQSYFLALVPPERIQRCLFPLAETCKADARARLKEKGLVPPLPAESQEICFIPGDDHCAWLRCRQAEGLALPGEGPVVLEGENKVIARHRGLWNYTEGQRHGLRIAWREPLYVLKRDPASNTLFVGPRNYLCEHACSASQLNIMVDPELWPDRIFARTRYRQSPVRADIRISGGRMLLAFEKPQAPHAPGQVAAVYDEEGYVLAGGILD